MRLDKYIVGCGVASRKEIKKMVKEGRVLVDNVKAAKSDMQVNETKSCVVVDGEQLIYREFIYLMLNKPSGYLSATYDARQKTVIDLLPEKYLHFEPFPVGRLDIDTEGLLILTNDGKLAHEITSPKKHVYKTYFAKLDKPAQEEDIQVFKDGMELDKSFTTMPAELEILDDPTNVLVKICEGKFHQVKRMCEKVGKKVLYLERIQMGQLKLDTSLQRGQMRELTQEEIDMIIG